MRISFTFMVLTLAFLVTDHFCIAQKDSTAAIIPDRPAQGLSPYTVKKGFFQIESGVIFVDREDQTRDWEKWSLGTTKFRYGVFDHFEVSVKSSYEIWTIEELSSETVTTYEGFGPVTAAFKVGIAEEKGVRPQMAIAGSITFRHLGDEYFAPTFSYPVGLFLASHTLSKRFSLGYNIGFAYNGEKPDGFFIYTGSLSYRISDKICSFAEAYGNFDHGDQPNHRLDGGFTFLIRNNLQLDATAGWGLDSDVRRLMLNAGFAWRIPR